MDLKTQNWLKSVIVLLLTASFLTSCGPSDAQISEEVNNQLAALEPGVKGTVDKGVVTLNGEFTDETQKNAIEESIKNIKGVKQVINNATIKAATLPPVEVSPDDDIKTRIEQSLQEKGISGVSVMVVSGEVTLTGEVKQADLMTVMQAANESKPRKVVNQLKIIK